MEKLSTYLQELKHNFEQHPFFNYIKTSDGPINQRLRFLPEMAHFVMSFSDLNKYVLPFVNPSTDLEIAVNMHALEDANHSMWYISDLDTMGFNENVSTTKNISYLWSDELAPSRILTYELVGIIKNKPAEARLAIIEAIEATGNAFFSILTTVTGTAASPVAAKLKYLGALHLSHETGHTIGSNDNLLDSINFTDSEYLAVRHDIDKTFAAFYKFIDQLYTHLIDQKL
ncbi:hypothetical protein [Pedobacter cryoconitis]|uniref:Uncharacterized protein n=1 Tax=Pedobacter cryoconitis TaxID=188932 RepID=A0A7X0MGT1_9SPHI|nr:hypothetical protein [Pedobacter cryoconitis]MBB6498394.1 hypothetical protein [Pedobacter cryoconitis]